MPIVEEELAMPPLLPLEDAPASYGDAAAEVPSDGLVLRYTDDLVVMLPPRRMPASPSFLQSMIGTTGEAPAADLVFEYLDFGRLLFVSLQARAVFARALRVGVHEELLIPVPPFLGRNSNGLRHVPPANLFNRDTSVSLEARDLVPVHPLSSDSSIQRKYDNNPEPAVYACVGIRRVSVLRV